MKIVSSDKRLVPTRVVRNSGWSYLQLATGGLTGFLSATLVLKALGVSVYGTYASVAAFVSAGGMLNAVVQRTATRFLGVELGKVPGVREMAETFSSCLSLVVLVVLALMALGETGGLWFLETCLRYPPEFAASARMAFQGLLLAIAFRLLTLPFVCRIIAAERLSALAVAALGTGCLRLMAAASLFVLPGLGLGGYAVLLALADVLTLVALAGYCRRAFPDVTFRIRLRTDGLREQGAFFGWGLLSSLANMLKYNGTCVLVNAFGGVTAAAAWDLALKTGQLLSKVSEGALQAATPRAMKLWSGASRRAFLAFSGLTLKWTFSGTLVVAIPLIVFVRPVLGMFLEGGLPPDVMFFLGGLLVHFILDSLTAPLTMAINATGRIVVYQIGVSLAMGVGFLLAWLSLGAGRPAWSAAFCVAAGTLLSLVYRVWCLGWLLALPPRKLLKEMFCPRG